MHFVKTKEELLQMLANIKTGTEVNTREKVLPYSWINIALSLEQIYSEVLKDAGSKR